jgi:hypothetical protein
MASELARAMVGKYVSVCAKIIAVMAPGDGDSPAISRVAPNMSAAPARCNRPSIFSVATNRSAITPTKKGEIMPAMGPTAYKSPMSSPVNPIRPRYFAAVTCQEPQMKNSKNIIADNRRPVADKAQLLARVPIDGPRPPDDKQVA